MNVKGSGKQQNRPLKQNNHRWFDHFRLLHALFRNQRTVLHIHALDALAVAHNCEHCFVGEALAAAQDDGA